MPVEEATEEDRMEYPGYKVPIGILRGNSALPPIGLIFTHYDSFEVTMLTALRESKAIALS